MRAARFAGAFTFQYSPRPGTPAATMPDQVPKAVVQERYERLVALQEEISWAENSARSAARSRCWSPRARAARTGPPTGCPGGPGTTGSCTSPSGDVVPRGRATSSRSQVTYAAPHHLVADGPFGGVRRTRAGDAWEPASAP